ncbi:uncharacterized protein BO87DRAFT_425438 [Aspergillus neoniger CBS 115656]|uniref:Uncharacterized protein n=1 Tax=Aspergillus neoniger (strain CBS 115656) TaxID=1448310 RepID=A0A318ZF23_ASPNB|nr:hypothetical protein BO87DRAFT_425438 [Aspergillus neoniger CBS 115656]PYH34752.1 hypothetical protein BO87DRAFT_425438 [Aspergillus neoniger CBS 115656]
MREFSKVVVHSPGDVEHSEDQITGIVIDSLVAIETRNWARKTIWLKIPMSALSKVKTAHKIVRSESWTRPTAGSFLAEVLRRFYLGAKLPRVIEASGGCQFLRRTAGEIWGGCFA